MSGVQRYVSKELSHFVGRGLSHADDQFALLLHILRTGWLTHPPHRSNVSGNLSVNPMARLSSNEMCAPQILCFCDIPIEDLNIHTAKYSPLAFPFRSNSSQETAQHRFFTYPEAQSYVSQNDYPLAISRR